MFQKWEEDDYRMVRFVGKTKLVNENWAAKLIDSVPPEARKERVVSCDGGGGPTGHPKVYINLVKISKSCGIVHGWHSIYLFYVLCLGQAWESCLPLLWSSFSQGWQSPLRVYIYIYSETLNM
jgi:hypothetical protein